MPGRDADLLDLIPYDVAYREWSQLRPDLRYDPPPRAYIPARYRNDPSYVPEPPPPPVRVRHDGACPVCGWPQGERGFVRLPFPPGHRFMGRAICCPRCWPWPFGEAPDGVLSGQARQIASMWDRERAKEREAVR